MQGAESIARMIARYRIFEMLYLKHQSLARENLEKALIKLYASILLYLARAKRYFQERTASTLSILYNVTLCTKESARILRSAVSVNEEFESLDKEMGLAESEIDSYAKLVTVES